MSVHGSFSKDLERARRGLPLMFRQFTDRVSRDLRDEVKKRTPVVTGEHRESIVTIPTNRRFTPTLGHQVWTGGAKSDLKTMSYLEDDTAPHIIRAKTDQGLVFFSKFGGKTVARQYVMHPGTTGMHMFAKASAVLQSQMSLRGNALLNRWAVRYGLR